MVQSFQSYRFAFEEVCPSVEEIKTFLESDKLDNDHPVNVFIGAVLPKLADNPDIKGGYILKRMEKMSLHKGMITVEGQGLKVGRQICAYIKKAEYLALFACTAGSLFSRLSEQMNQKGDFMEAFIVDAIGSLTVEKAMDKVQKQLEQMLGNEDLKITNRYSPGYCNWHLSSQQLLFHLIGDNPTGISLTDSCLMIPVKSVSGIIGIGPDVKKREYGCLVCNNSVCIYRKIIHRS